MPTATMMAGTPVVIISHCQPSSAATPCIASSTNPQTGPASVPAIGAALMNRANTSPRWESGIHHVR